MCRPMLCIKAHYKLKIRIFASSTFHLASSQLKTMLNHKRVYPRFVAAQLRVYAIATNYNIPTVA